MGGNIPYMKLGFRNLDDLLKSMKDVVSSSINYLDGLLYVKAVPLAGSSHINELVQGQRKAKKKKSNTFTPKYKTFRVASTVAPNRNFNRNYSTYKAPPRFVNPSAYSQHDNRANLTPQLMQPRQETSAPALQPSRPNYTAAFKAHNTDKVPTRFGNPPAYIQHDNRANLTPQLMQPRQERPQSRLNYSAALESAYNQHDNRANLIPQLMQPRLQTSPPVLPPSRPNHLVAFESHNSNFNSNNNLNNLVDRSQNVVKIPLQQLNKPQVFHNFIKSLVNVLNIHVY